MQSSNIPSKIPLPFAYAAGSSYKNTIPTASQIGITNGKASLTDGFPPLTFQPISSGGIPPFGADFNGILNEITAIQQWQEAGGFFPFDATFAAAVNGYPKGAIIQSTSQAGFWISTIENNSNNPDTGGAGWVPDSFYGTQSISLSGSSVTLTPLQAAYPIIILTGALTSNCNVVVPNFSAKWIFVNNTTGGYTVQVVPNTSGGGVNLVQNGSTYVYGDGTNIYYANSAQVSSFNGRTGAVSLNATDVTSALGYVPVNPAQFIEQFGIYGYQKLPGGLILQWGPPDSTTNPQTVNFPITFPNACLNIVITPYYIPTPVAGYASISSFSTTGFTMYKGFVNGGWGCFYFATGY